MTEQPRLHIRPGMDVYNADQTRYLGSVVRVFRAASQNGSAEQRGATGRQTGSASDATQGNPPLTHEEGQQVSPTAAQGRPMLGEEMGPFPTIAAGNTGPVNQSARHEYATEPIDSNGAVHAFAVRPGRVNLGILTPPFYVPTQAIRSLSMDRIVVGITGAEIPEAWRRKPD